MKSKTIYIIILSIFFLSESFAQSKNKQVLATVGSKKIYLKEFTQRFELVPRLSNRPNENPEKQKEDLLYSIIAEKLWADAAKSEGFDTTAIMRLSFNDLKDMYLRDALYKRMVASKIKMTNSMLQQALNRNKYELYVSYIVSYNKNQINLIYKRLISGADFNSFLPGKGKTSSSLKPVVITFGKSPKYLEDKIFKLKVGQFTKPIKTTNEWIIFKLIKKEKKHYTSNKEAKNDISKVHGIVRDRIAARIETEYKQKLLAHKKISTNGYLFWSIANNLIKILKEHKKEGKIKKGSQLTLEDDDIYKFEKALGPDTLSMVFVKFKKNPVTVEQFLRQFIFEGFYVNTLNPNTIRLQLESRVKRFIELEILTRKAYSMGLENLPEVKKPIEIWREHYLSTLWKRSILKKIKVTKKEAYNFYEKTHNKIIVPKEVNIIEVLTKNLDVVKKVLDGLAKGESLRKLAKLYTIRKWTKPKGGEFGFFPVTMYGEIGRVADKMKIGEIYGPLKTKNGYSIFKLIGIKKAKLKYASSFNDVKNEITKQLKAKMVKNILIKKTVEFAEKYGVTVNQNLLKSLKVKNLQMLVYKYMGFGGRILAFPLTPSFSVWAKKWKKNQQILP